MCFFGHDTRQLVERGDLAPARMWFPAAAERTRRVESPRRDRRRRSVVVMSPLPRITNRRGSRREKREDGDRPPVYSGGPDDDDLIPVARPASRAICLQLGLLIYRRAWRGILVGWAFDVPHADRAAMNDASAPARLLDDGPHCGRSPRDRLPQSCLTVNRGDVIDDLDPRPRRPSLAISRPRARSQLPRG